jgi:hypothetical protein
MMLCSNSYSSPSHVECRPISRAVKRTLYGRRSPLRTIWISSYSVYSVQTVYFVWYQVRNCIHSTQNHQYDRELYMKYIAASHAFYRGISEDEQQHAIKNGKPLLIGHHNLLKQLTAQPHHHEALYHCSNPICDGPCSACCRAAPGYL